MHVCNVSLLLQESTIFSFNIIIINVVDLLIRLHHMHSIEYIDAAYSYVSLYCRDAVCIVDSCGPKKPCIS